MDEQVTGTATYTRRTDDPYTAEEFLARSGQKVTLLGDSYDAEPGEEIFVQYIRFADGYRNFAFLDELTDIERSGK